MAVQENLVCKCLLNAPVWAKRSVFYQIFPDRFFNGDITNDPFPTATWGSAPKTDNFFGGDLKGIVNKIPYLKSLGISALYLNPIFKAKSNHKYNTQDYLRIDPAFGDLDSFRDLVSQLHRNGMKIILDGVFNHTGINFWAFQDVVAKGGASKFVDWYYLKEFPVQMNPPNYQCWWNISDLPKLNVANPAVRNYLKRVIAYWTRREIDGWRLDVPNEIEMSFWREFRTLVKSINPEAYLVGEIWQDGTPWLKGDQFDAVMNYRWRDLVIEYLVNPGFSTAAFSHGLTEIMKPLSLETNLLMLNLLGSHDTPRILTMLKGRISLVKLAVALQMTYPGVPCIYYGDEVGLWGEKDPDCRRTMPWDLRCNNQDLLQYYQKIIKIRQSHSCFQEGLYYPLILWENQEFFGFLRVGQQESGLVLINRTVKSISFSIPADIILGLIAKGHLLLNLTQEPHWKVELKPHRQIEFHLKPHGSAIWLIT
ncbi:MAG: glycoside hydrolase family 13 protein [Bacillota bacterium]